MTSLSGDERGVAESRLPVPLIFWSGAPLGFIKYGSEANDARMDQVSP
jgi:hypothetical protein